MHTHTHKKWLPMRSKNVYWLTSYMLFINNMYEIHLYAIYFLSFHVHSSTTFGEFTMPFLIHSYLRCILFLFCFFFFYVFRIILVANVQRHHFQSRCCTGKNHIRQRRPCPGSQFSPIFLWYHENVKHPIQAAPTISKNACHATEFLAFILKHENLFWFFFFHLHVLLLFVCRDNRRQEESILRSPIHLSSNSSSYAQYLESMPTNKTKEFDKVAQIALRASKYLLNNNCKK